MEVDGRAEVRNPSSNGVKQKGEEEKEGRFLLGRPTFDDLGNGRLRCVETGHEMPARDRDSYACSKGCRLALIDAALSQKKPPLNMFHPHPLSKSKLVCNLTGDTINKSEEHIWKHINGRRFQNKLEQTEVEKLVSAEEVEKDTKQSRKLAKSRMVAGEKDRKQDADGIGSLVKDSTELGSHSEEPLVKDSAEHGSDSEEPDFWTPPVGSRWDFDDGRDRWESCASSGRETDDDVGSGVNEKDGAESVELSMRAKRMSIAVGPSSFASRKKKIKKTLPSNAIDNEI